MSDKPKSLTQQLKETPKPSQSDKKKKIKKLLSADDFFNIKNSDKTFRGPQETRGSLGEVINQFREMDKNIGLKMATGGRVGLKSGSKGCKLAMKGKGRAYGKNS